MREFGNAPRVEANVLRSGDWHAKWSAAALPQTAGVTVEFEQVGAALGLDPRAIRLAVDDSWAACVRGAEAMDSLVLYSFLAGVQAGLRNSSLGVVRSDAHSPRPAPASGTVPPAEAP